MVTELDSYRDHAVIQTLDGAAHVIPVITLKRFASGHLSLDFIEDGEDIMRSITNSWLASLKKNH